MVFLNFNLKTFKAQTFLQVHSVGIGLDRIRFDRNRRRAEAELLKIAETQDNIFIIDKFEELIDSSKDIRQIVCPPRVCPTPTA